MNTSILPLTLTLLVILAACSSAPAEPSEIKLGAILFLTNHELSVIAQSFQEGIDMAVDEINAAGGIDGKMIKVVYEDDQLQEVKAVTAAHKLTSVDNVDAALTGVINTVKPIGGIFESTQTPLVMIWDSKIKNDGMDDLHHLVSAGFSTPEAGQDLARFAYHNLSTRSVSIVYQADHWSELIAHSFRDEFKRLGGEVISDERVDATETDFKGVLLKSKSAEAIYAPLISNADVFFKRVRESGYEGQLLGGDTITDQVIANAGDAVEGLHFTQVWEPSDGKMQEFKAKYTAKYGKDAQLGVFNALAYDDVYMIADAMKRSGYATNHDREKFTQALYGTSGLDGVLGPITIDSFGSHTREERVFVVKNGKMEVVE